MDIYINITSGNGPRECQWVVVKLAQAFVKEAKREELEANIVWDGEAVLTAPSLLLGLKGEGAKAFVNDRLGTVRWIGQSPFRKNHKRKNWFAGVNLVPKLEDVPSLKESDIRYQTMKASGPGGQHVNKTESAVRAIHVPTGLTVTASDERSQFANKKLTKIK
ncbi:MAG: peptide chain release factor H, partial [Maricaulaceae bacterium]